MVDAGQQGPIFRTVGSGNWRNALRANGTRERGFTLRDVIQALPEATTYAKGLVEACREIMESAPGTRVIMLTASAEEDAVVEAVAAGATGYLQKESGLDRLLSAVRGVADGELRVSAEVVTRVFAEIRAGAKTRDAVDIAGLTQREREILISFAMVMSCAQISDARGVKPVTVRNAIYRIQSKLGVGTMQGLVVWAVRNGLLDDYGAEGSGRPSA